MAFHTTRNDGSQLDDLHPILLKTKGMTISSTLSDAMLLTVVWNDHIISQK